MQEVEVTRIKPGGRWLQLDLKEVWAYRELLYFLSWRDVKIRYKQTAIGIVWAVLQPVLTTAIFTVIFSRFARFDTGGVPYPLFALSGLMIWLFVNTSITMASTSFVNNTNLVTKVYFPRLIVPMAATIASLFDLLFGVVILAILIVWYGTYPNILILLAPVFMLLAVMLAIGLGMLFSALNVRFRDVKFALPFLLQVWMIASPIFYPMSLLSGRWKLVFAVNPLMGILEGFRASLFGSSFEWDVIAISGISAVLLTALSFIIFRSMEDDFADFI